MISFFLISPKNCFLVECTRNICFIANGDVLQMSTKIICLCEALLMRTQKICLLFYGELKKTIPESS